MMNRSPTTYKAAPFWRVAYWPWNPQETKQTCTVADPAGEGLCFVGELSETHPEGEDELACVG